MPDVTQRLRTEYHLRVDGVGLALESPDQELE